jgi:hypothetical protein
MRVTGIGVFDDQVVPATASDGEPMVLLSPAFTRTKAAALSIYLAQAGVRLRPGNTPAAFIAAATAAERKGPPPQSGSPLFINLSDQVAATERAIRPEAVALGVFAALAGLIALAVTGQLLARQLAMDSAELPVLRALGASTGSVLGVALARLAVVTVAGAVLAVTAAIAASPLTPVGAARLAEPDPGIEVNAGILSAGLAIIALAPLLLLALPAWRAANAALGTLVAGQTADRARPSRLTAALAVTGPVAAALGVRMALDPGRGRTAVPVRSALAGTTLAIGALVAAAVFGASLAGLVGTPARYGQNWDAELNLGFAAVPAPLAAARILAAEPAITGYAAGDTGQVSVDGALVPAVGVDALGGGPSGGIPVSGSATGGAGGYLTLLAGHAPTGPGQIALGALTMRAVHAQLGQDVQVAVNFATGVGGPQRPRTMRVVGEAVFPNFGLSGLSDTDLGNGAIVATSLLTTTQANTGCTGHIACYDLFLLRYRPGTNMAAAASALLTATAKAGCPAGVCTVTASQQPGDIQDYASVRDTPLLLGAVLGVLAAGTLAHVLLTGVRCRRRDLAVLKAGLTRAQLRGAVAWEATTLAAAALLIGVPAGIVAGRLAWAAFATEAGVASGATFDLALVLLTVPVTLLLANVIAAWPGRAAARLRPAAVLRAE